MHHALKALAREHTVFDGQVTIYMIPFRNAEVDIALSELQRLEPPIKWAHEKTGEERYTDPHPNPHGDPIIEEQRKASKWRAVELWSQYHHAYCATVPLTVDMVFTAELPNIHARALKAFWDARTGVLKQDWYLFRQAVSVDALLAWLEALDKTRDTSMFGPEELHTEPAADADPNS